jgi:hypothetical protein
MSIHARTSLAAIALAVLTVACGADSSVAPTSSVTLDQALAELTIPALSDAAASFSGAGALVPSIVPSRCPYQAASQSFVCAPLSGAGLTLTQSFTLLDASGAKQSAFDQHSTAALKVVSAVAGTLVQQGLSIAVDGQQELTLSGLLTDKHTLNGSSTTHTALTSADVGAQPITSTITTKITNLVIPVVPVGGPAAWPLSGTIELKVSTDLALQPVLGPGSTSVSTVTITFSGSSIVTLTITGPGVSRTCQANLALQGLACSG